jgi:hypothetical protein
MAWTQQRLAKVILENDLWLLNQPGVTAVSIALDSAGTPCLEISTDSITPDSQRRVEERLQGVPLVFTHTGPINAQ